MPAPVTRPFPVVRVAAAAFGGAAVGVAAFAASWWLLAGAAPPALAWAAGGAAAAFLGSEVGSRSAIRFAAPGLPSEPSTPNPTPVVPAEPDDAPPERHWRDRVRADSPSRVRSR